MNAPAKSETCGTCKHYEVLHKTPTGREKKGMHGNCKGVLTLVKPLAYDVTISKRAVWAKTDAASCPLYESVLGHRET